jgi:NTP pyrophosphatase (non-canonical NTP hydrolase)
MKELRSRLRSFAEEREWETFHSPKNLAMALSVEVAEIVEHFQWLTEEQSLALSLEKRARIAGEIGDVLIYLTRLADVLGIDPLEAAFRKMVINADRYPVAKSKGRSSKYNEL